MLGNILDNKINQDKVITVSKLDIKSISTMLVMLLFEYDKLD